MLITVPFSVAGAVSNTSHSDVYILYVEQPANVRGLHSPRLRPFAEQQEVCDEQPDIHHASLFVRSLCS